MDKGAPGGGAGEVRRINVVYFLSRGGRTDHPHLFRVNHHSRAGGVRLRDVKRWLSEIRSKDMPDNFSWSYKRKYKGGYVWQDLKDDDLITPISDNEYVLKGCDVRGTPPHCAQAQAPKTTPSLDETTRDEKKTTCGDRADRAVEVGLTTPDSDESSPKPPPPADDQNSPGSSGGDLAARRGTVLFKIEVSHSSQGLQGQNHHQQQQQQEEEEEEEEERKEEPVVKAVVSRAVARPAPDQEQLQGAVRGHAVAGGKARTMRVARALHNIMTCGAADADDAAIRPVARRQRRGAAEAGGGNDEWLPPPTPTCPGIGMDGCGLRVSRKARLRKGGKEKQEGKRDGGKRDGPGDARKPAALPRCSQCGKEFKPQELHSHMQSCRGLKERMKSSAGARISLDKSREFAARSAEHRRSKPGRCTPERPSPASAVFLLTES